MRRTVTRRQLLTAGAGFAGIAAAAAFGLRLGTSPLSTSGTRTVDPRVLAIYLERRTVRAAREAATTSAHHAAHPLAEKIVALHSTQDQVLSARLRDLGQDPDHTGALDQLVQDPSTSTSHPTIPGWPPIWSTGTAAATTSRPTTAPTNTSPGTAAVSAQAAPGTDHFDPGTSRPLPAPSHKRLRSSPATALAPPTSASATALPTDIGTPVMPTSAPTFPDDGVRPTPTSPAGDNRSSRPGDLLEMEAKGTTTEGPDAVTAIPATEAPLLLSVKIQRRACTLLLTGQHRATTSSSAASREKKRPPVFVSTAQAARAATALRAAQYGLEVATARSNGDQRTRLSSVLTWLTALRLDAESHAGQENITAPDGYALPAPVNSPDSALRLAHTCLTTLTDSLLAGAEAAAGAPDALLTLLEWGAGAEARAHDLGAPLRPFPGLRPR
ncbi:hypothetical protein [Austwickia sp. TVS 96-490-7B]|uniref:hypothetical protein n=1 Tax=Austwickia sp. TVS 96-490-7B TaxID=2830843 RepID=UPI001C56BD6D|nr:hypothetical protein [Austwickia sp. TVS 96-490-7B]